MQKAHSYRGLWVAGLFLVAAFAGLSFAPSAAADVTTQRPISMVATTTNVWDPSTTPPTGTPFANLAESSLISWRTDAQRAMFPGTFNNFLDAAYTTGASSTDLLDTTATAYFTKDGSAPSRTGSKITLTAEKGPGGQLVAKQDQIYHGSFAPADLAGATTIRFMIELNKAGSTSTPFACDVGSTAASRATGTPRVAVSQAQCAATAAVGDGFTYAVDLTRPIVVANSFNPTPRTDAVAGTFLINLTKAAGETFKKTLRSTVNFTVDANGTAGRAATGFNTVLDLATVRISVGGVVRYDGSVNGGARGGANVFHPIPKLGGYRYEFVWVLNDTSPQGNDFAADTELAVVVEARDLAGNPTGTGASGGTAGFRVSNTMIADRTAPTLLFRNAVPAVFKVESQGPANINVTGVGGVAAVKVVLPSQEKFISKTDSRAVRAWIWAGTPTEGGAPTRCVLPKATSANVQDSSKCLFASGLTTLRFIQRDAITGLSTFQGNVTLTNASGVVPSLAFGANLSVFLRDISDNTNVTSPFHTADGMTDTGSNRTNVFQVRPGIPAFVLAPSIDAKLNTTNPAVARGGPYNVTVKATDPDGIRMLKIRIFMTAGNFTTAEGWTKINNVTYENSETPFTDPLPTTVTRKFAIPSQTANVKMNYEAIAQDALGNTNSTSTRFNRSLAVDRSAPQILEPSKKAWRNGGPQKFIFGLLDLGGADVNATSGKIEFRLKGAASYTRQKLTVVGNLANVTISVTGTHKQVVEYFTYINDRVGNNGTNGTNAAPRNYTLDLVKPTVTMDPTPANSLDGKFSLTTLATDADSGIDRVIFEGRSRSLTGTFPAFAVLQNSTSPGFGPLCLGGGAVYEFRAFAIDKAGNVGERSDPRTSTVTGAGCVESLTASVSRPTGGSLVDAQGGTGKQEVRFTAASTSTFTSAGLIHIKLEFSPDDGAHYHMVVGDAPNTGSYNWTVNEATCDKCKLRITASIPGGKNVTAVSATFEVINGNPNTDYDGNGLYDECELRYFRAIGSFKPNDDSDGDGLKNQVECSLGTSPTNPDTDGDGVSDGAETRLHRDPLNPNDKPSVTDLRFEQWESRYLLVIAVFVALVAVFVLGLARRW